MAAAAAVGPPFALWMRERTGIDPFWLVVSSVPTLVVIAPTRTALRREPVLGSAAMIAGLAIVAIPITLIGAYAFVVYAAFLSSFSEVWQTAAVTIALPGVAAALSFFGVRRIRSRTTPD